MKNILILLLVLFIVQTSKSQQILSVELLESYTVQGVEDLASSANIPSGIIVPETGVDYYKITYLTPYLHPDSLVQASGAIAVPTNPYCSYPLAGYGHGTGTKKSKVASQMAGGQWEIGVLFASTGFVVALPDYLGLGDADSRIPIHPYTHSYSQSNTMINILRATRTLTDSIQVTLNDQVFLFGYSEGGGTTVATVKEIQENYPNEFNIAGSAPMSGAYDLIDAQVDLMVSDSTHPRPAYLPYIVLAYQSIYENIYNDVSEFLTTPYDTIIPELFYEGNTTIGGISQECTPVPKDMVIDSVLTAFVTDPNHPLRLNLRDNDMINGWFPESPMKLIYCNGDDQVTYLNSENAFNFWTSEGAPSLKKQDMGDWGHNDCALFAMLAARNYFDSLAISCALSIENDEEVLQEYEISPNPSRDIFEVQALNSSEFEDVVWSLVDLSGRIVRQKHVVRSETIIVERENLPDGIYLLRIDDGDRILFNEKVVFH